MTKRFIPAADEVGRLQSGNDAECKLFQKIAEQGHYAGQTVPSSTRQGTYATTADGRLLASWNSNDPRHVARKLREALARWDAMNRAGELPDSTAGLDPAQVHRDEHFYPENGLVLRVNTRDLPREQPISVARRWADAWNQDFAWFTRDEAARFVPSETAVGARADVPRALVDRLARFHFVDNVRGQTTSFPARAVRVADLNSQITGVEGDVVSVRLEGHTRTEDEGRWAIRGYRDMNSPSAQKRGVDLELLGFAKFDRALGRFVEFELVAIGMRWGGTQYNGRGNDLGEAPFGATLTLAGATRAERVAPEHFYGYGWRQAR